VARLTSEMVCPPVSQTLSVLPSRVMSRTPWARLHENRPLEGRRNDWFEQRLAYATRKLYGAGSAAARALLCERVGKQRNLPVQVRFPVMLYGRDDELRSLTELVANVRADRSGVLVIRGEAGIGKTAILAEVAARAGDMLVLRGTAIETEAELPFAGLHLLLRPLLDRLDELPQPQANALRRALFAAGPADHAGEDRLLTGLAVLSLLAEAAPLLCLVDDAQWLDAASADALLFAARRLDAEGVALLFTVRDGSGSSFPSAGLPELRLDPLSYASGLHLLAERAPDLDPPAREQVLAEARGNPLALNEFAAAASHGTVTSPGPLPAPRRVQDAYTARIRSLGERTARVLLLAAAESSGESSLVLEAAGRFGADAAALAPAERAGLITVTERIEFRHPLIRSAAYHDTPLDWRRTAHMALAEVLSDRDSDDSTADRQAWHLAATTDSPDEEVAAGLERAARRAGDRDAYAAAAAAWERAAQLTADPETRARRLAAGVGAAADAGHASRALRLANEAIRLTTDPMIRADVTYLIAQHRGLPHAPGVSDLLEATAAIAAPCPARAATMLTPVFFAAWRNSDYDLSAKVAHQFRDLERAGRLRPIDEFMLRHALFMSGQADRPRPRSLLAGLAAKPECASIGERGNAARIAYRVGDHEALYDISAALTAELRTRGMPGSLGMGLIGLAMGQLLRGDWAQARANALEGLRLTCDCGQPLRAQYLTTIMSLHAALTGDEDDCVSWLDEHRRMGGPAATQESFARHHLALLDLSHRRFGAALERLSAPDLHAWVGQMLFVIQPDLVEAAARSGHLDLARATLADFTDWTGLDEHPWALAVTARCRALTSQDPDAPGHYEEAIRLHAKAGNADRPFERARTMLLYGEWLRRGRQQAAARDQLIAAREIFDRLGALAWAECATAELRATGLSETRVREPGRLAALTPQEFQIVRLAAQGLSNRDIAAQLFLSHRTVGYHLYKAYPKLGIGSRTELTAILEDQ
jgi:DNA-binding CsgD family transcriptional regulator